MKIALLILLMIFSSAGLADLLSPSVEKVLFDKKLAGYDIKVKQDSATGPWLSATLEGSDTEAQCTYSVQEPLISFLNAGEYKLGNYKNPVVISKWSVGVHGQRLVIIDPTLKKDCVIDEISSADGLDFEVKDGQLVIQKFNDSRNPDEVAEQTQDQFWAPPKNPKK
jgi:hypothetical protein